MQTKTKTIYGLFVFLLLMACVNEFNARIPLSGSQILVVEGNIIADSLVEFSFSKSFALAEKEPPEGYDAVEVTLVVIGSDGSRSLPAKYLGKGVHQLKVNTLNAEVEYGVEFEYEGELYRSDLLKPLYTPAIDSVSWLQPDKNGDVSIYISTHEEKDGAFKYYLWNYKEDWEIEAYYNTFMFLDTKTEQFYTDYSEPYRYCWKRNTGAETLVGTTEALTDNKIINKKLYDREAVDEKFSALYCATVTQQAISKSAYEYYLDKAKGNEGMGGIFTPQPSKMEGNITCITNSDKKTIGYIGVAANVEEKRMFISRKEITRPSVWSSCAIISADSVRKYMNENRVEGYTGYYYLGYRPINGFEQNDKEGNLVYMPGDWSRSYCTDCRENGGSKTKPDFWPNDHQ